MKNREVLRQIGAFRNGGAQRERQKELSEMEAHIECVVWRNMGGGVEFNDPRDSSVEDPLPGTGRDEW